jgi:LacI family transcriptional regulator
MKSGQVTIKDIAQRLKISAATVSRALKDHPDISKGTKKAVLALANELDYQPNSIALSLRQQKTHMIGVIVPEIVHFFFSSVISGIEDVAYSAGYHVMICQSNEQYEREVVNTQALLANRVDGILVSVSKSSKQFDHFQTAVKKGVPLVFFDRVCTEIEVDRVVVEDYQGAYQAVEHLIRAGCKRIAHLAGPETLLISQQRLNGYLDALRNHGMEPDTSLIVIADDYEDGHRATMELLKRKNRPDALFTVNDNAAVGALKAVKQKGLQVPDDIAIIGFSDDPKVTNLVDPPLSSIRQPAFEIGQEAARLLIAQIEHKGEKRAFETKVLKTNLHARESTNRKAMAMEKVKS